MYFFYYYTYGTLKKIYLTVIFFYSNVFFVLNFYVRLLFGVGLTEDTQLLLCWQTKSKIFFDVESLLHLLQIGDIMVLTIFFFNEYFYGGCIV